MSTPLVDFFIFFLAFKFNLVHCEQVSVKISTREHVNIVSDKFLSFTVDPRFLFAKNGRNVGEDCLCMAAALSPAYIRIGGPSTAQMDFINRTLLINATDNEVTSPNRLAVDVRAWRRFAEWAGSNRFELVFALNGEGKTEAGIWDPNTALSILSVAEEAGIERIVWQLGYECRNRSAEEYLEELGTLRVMVGTFAAGRAGGWRVTAGDVTPCLAAASKASFRDYVAATNEMLDAVFLNGNSSALQLDKLEESDRVSLLELLSKSSTPLWITESRDDYSELERAVDWLTSLGFSARSGFNVHFRELTENELYEPTLSFYMSLLFKNLVGDRVLEVSIQEDFAVADRALFAHCTTLKHQPVPGAITLFGANMDEQVVRFSIKLSKREEGGDIMQFILSQDIHGNTLVNGHPVFYEGDIKPVVKRVRPYKTLLITLPPKSFGFWVLANTNIEACHKTDENGNNPRFVPATPVEDIRNKMAFAHKGIRNKRETPLFRDDVILHKWIGHNEIQKNIFINPKFEDHVGQEIVDVQEALSDVQEIEQANRCIDNFVQKTKDQYDSDNENEMDIKYIFRQKRQTLADKLKAAVSKLKSNPNKYEAKHPKITTTKLHVPLKALKFKDNNTKTAPKNPTDPKKILKETEVSVKEDHVQKSESPNNLLKANKSKSLLDNSKARIQELRRRLQARKSVPSEETTQVKQGLKLTKRSTADADKKISNFRFYPKHTVKRSNDLVLRKDESFFQEKHSNSLRKKRSTEGLTKLNSIIENSDISVLKKILNKASDKLNDYPETKLEGNYKSGNFEDEIKPESTSNEIPKKHFNAKEDKTFEDQILLKTKISDDDASISIDEKSNQHVLLKDAFESVSTFLEDLRENFARILAVIPNFP